NAEDCHLEGA
ncbi:hypothetical protein CFC21_105057, partial [Triticum aestivum]